MILKSAGILSPVLIFIISPGTKYHDLIKLYYPFLNTNQLLGYNFFKNNSA